VDVSFQLLLDVTSNGSPEQLPSGVYAGAYDSAVLCKKSESGVLSHKSALDSGHPLVFVHITDFPEVNIQHLRRLVTMPHETNDSEGLPVRQRQWRADLGSMPEELFQALTNYRQVSIAYSEAVLGYVREWVAAEDPANDSIGPAITAELVFNG
jgi:hypothetical protein